MVRNRVGAGVAALALAGTAVAAVGAVRVVDAAQAAPAGAAQAALTVNVAAAGTTRDPRLWPFAWNSIWNLPRGADAKLVAAGIPPASGAGMTADEDILVLEPTAPRTNVVVNDAGWDGGRTRCGSVQQGNVLFRDVPIPTGFSTDPGYLGRTPNHSAALLLADGDTIVNTQPFHRCGAGGVATSQYDWGRDHLRAGDGIPGAHGGSGLSSLGGTVRSGELVPGGVIRHALKVNLDCTHVCSYSVNEPDGKAGFRWPAQNADSSAAGRYGGKVAALQMGSLLTLPTSFDVSKLTSEPARIIARALQDYGGYVVDDTGWPVYSIETEWSPSGRVVNEFQAQFGFGFETDKLANCTDTSAECAWARDLGKVFTSLAVVDDNGPTTIGGAGARRAPCAPPYADGSGGAPADCGPAAASAPPPTTAPPAPTTTTPATTAPPTTAAPTTTAPATTAPTPTAPAPTTTAVAPTTTAPTTTAVAPTTTTTVAPTTTTTTAAPATTTTAAPSPPTPTSTPIPTPTVAGGPERRRAAVQWLLQLLRALLRLLGHNPIAAA